MDANTKKKLEETIKTLSIKSKVLFGGQIVALLLSLLVNFMIVAKGYDIVNVFYVLTQMTLCSSLYCIRNSCSFTMVRFANTLEGYNLDNPDPDSVDTSAVENFDIDKGNLSVKSVILDVAQMILALSLYITIASKNRYNTYFFILVLYFFTNVLWFKEVIITLKTFVPHREEIRRAKIISKTVSKIKDMTPEDLDIGEVTVHNSEEEVREYIREHYDDDQEIHFINVDGNTDPEEIAKIVSKEIEKECSEKDLSGT